MTQQLAYTMAATEDEMFEVGRIWLVCLGVGMAAAGATFVLLAGTPAFARLGRLLDAPFWPAGSDATARRFQAWAYSVTFATMAGWGVCLAIVAANAFASREAWAWWSVAAGVAVWYPLDTGRSLLHRVYVNAALNTALLIAVAIPLALTYGEFR
jgi:hypothetical protein